MSPSEKVRALLDERGIEHDDNDANTEVTGVRITRWKNGGKRDVRYEEWRNGTTRLDAGNVSPEQAIAATVTTEPDEATMLKLHDRMNAALLDYESAMGIEGGNGANTVPFVIEMHQIIEDAAKAGTRIEEATE